MSKCKPFMLDLFTGMGGSSQAMRARGWDVWSVDNNPRLRPDEVADLTTWHWRGPKPDLVWSSPPCTEFSRESMPWCKTGVCPSMSLVEAAMRIIGEINPRFYVIENVRGAIPHLGQWDKHVGPFYLWGFFPDFDADVSGAYKQRKSGRESQERGLVPFAVSEALAVAVENAIGTGTCRVSMKGHMR